MLEQLGNPLLFITSRLAEISFERMSIAIVPWLIPLLVVLVLLSLWPPLSTFLPGLFLGRPGF